MDLVMDANILFAALIKDSSTLDLIFNENIRLFAPEFLLEEFHEHKDEILAKTKRTKAEFEGIYEALKEIIKLIPSGEFSEFVEEVGKLTGDKDDVAYLALALRLNIPIWSNDKCLQRQKKVKIYSTEEVLGRV